MYIDKNALLINGINVGQYILEVEYGYNKLWGKDSGRNLKGEMSGSLLGVFPKLKVTFRKLTRTELELLAPIFDSAIQTITYYDPVLKRMYVMESYTGDWATLNRNIFTNVAKANQSFQISFISTKARPIV